MRVRHSAFIFALGSRDFIQQNGDENLGLSGNGKEKIEGELYRVDGGVER